MSGKIEAGAGRNPGEGPENPGRREFLKRLGRFSAYAGAGLMGISILDTQCVRGRIEDSLNEKVDKEFPPSLTEEEVRVAQAQAEAFNQNLAEGAGQSLDTSAVHAVANEHTESVHSAKTILKQNEQAEAVRTNRRNELSNNRHMHEWRLADISAFAAGLICLITPGILERLSSLPPRDRSS